MKNPDKFLIGIVAGVLLLVIVSVAVVLMQPEPTYLADDLPENIVHNYILAVLQEDYARAFGYLHPDIPHRPDDAIELQGDLDRYDYYADSDRSFSILSARVTGDRAIVIVEAIGFYSNDPFFGGRGYAYDEQFELLRLDGEWKIRTGEVFFPWCWTSKDGCD